jgi:hypothetical protein
MLADFNSFVTPLSPNTKINRQLRQWFWAEFLIVHYARPIHLKRLNTCFVSAFSLKAFKLTVTLYPQSLSGMCYAGSFTSQ